VLLHHRFHHVLVREEVLTVRMVAEMGGRAHDGCEAPVVDRVHGMGLISDPERA
jgi:hypothetical protein